MEFEAMLKKMVRDIIKEETEILTQEEIKKIIVELKPDLDKIISKRVREHLVALAIVIQKHFS